MTLSLCISFDLQLLFVLLVSQNDESESVILYQTLTTSMLEINCNLERSITTISQVNFQLATRFQTKNTNDFSLGFLQGKFSIDVVAFENSSAKPKI